LQLSTPYADTIPQTPHLFNRGRGCHLANKLQPYCETAKTIQNNLPVLNSHRQFMQLYDRLLSNSADLLLFPMTASVAIFLLDDAYLGLEFGGD